MKDESKNLKSGTSSETLLIFAHCSTRFICLDNVKTEKWKLRGGGGERVVMRVRNHVRRGETSTMVMLNICVLETVVCMRAGRIQAVCEEIKRHDEMFFLDNSVLCEKTVVR